MQPDSADPDFAQSVSVNGQPRDVAAPRRNLLSFLRFDLGLTGAKYGCGEGLCGACTVLVDGQPMRTCQATVGSVIGGSITTVEGLQSDGVLHPVQQAFVEESAMQCGYCIPGFIMAAAGFLTRQPQPTPDQIREALAEHICRCGAYVRIQRAVELAARRLAEERE